MQSEGQARGSQHIHPKIHFSPQRLFRTTKSLLRFLCLFVAIISSGRSGKELLYPFRDAFKTLRLFRFAFPDDEHAPTEATQEPLLQLIARGVAVEFGEPPVTSRGRRRAIFTTAMPMPETSMHKNGEPMFRQHHVRRDEPPSKHLCCFFAAAFFRT